MAGGAPPRSTVVRSAPSRRRRQWLGAAVLGVGAVAAILLVAGFVLPVPTPFSVSIRSEGFSPGVEYREFPAGAHVSFDWNTSSGRNATFRLLGPNGQVLSATTGAGGHLAFLAATGPYGFQSASFLPEVVDVHGNYASPVLP